MSVVGKAVVNPLWSAPDRQNADDAIARNRSGILLMSSGVNASARATAVSWFSEYVLESAQATRAKETPSSSGR